LSISNARQRRVRRNRWSNLEHLTPRDELKFVLADRHDYEWARAALQTHRLNQRVNAFLMSPVFGASNPPTSRVDLADRLPSPAAPDAQAHLVADARAV